MIIDSHCHLTYEPMSLNLKDTIDRANKDGVKYMLTISTEDKSFKKILNIIRCPLLGPYLSRILYKNRFIFLIWTTILNNSVLKLHKKDKI